jgi:formate-dependent nitrite reductase membrane component NrfD
MKHKEFTWGWMLAVDFFFAGMGGGMLLIAGIMDLFSGTGKTSLLGEFLAPVFVAIGASFLIFELGRPLRAWRVFMNPKAVLTVGAWNMLLAIGFGLVYASFSIAVLPWSGWAQAREILALLCSLVGLVVATYPGILLGRHKSRPFWTGGGMVVLFLTSSLVTGTAAHLLSGLILPPSSPNGLADVSGLAAGLLGFQLLIWPVSLWIKSSGTTGREAVAVKRWVSGDLSLAFQIGFLLIGTLAPLVLILLPVDIFKVIGTVLALLGGLLMRYLVIRSGEERTWLPGEEKYRSRLPLGDEAFLKAWKAK